MITKVFGNRAGGNLVGIVRLNEIMNTDHRIGELTLRKAALPDCFMRNFQKKVAGEIMTAPVNLIV